MKDTPVYMSGDCGMNGSWIWAFLLFALLGNGNGFGNGGYGQSALYDSQQFNQIDNGIRGLANGICDSAYALNNSIKDGTCNLASKIDENRYETRNCCCEVNRNIDGVSFNAERNANAVIQASNANTQRVIDYLCAQDKQRLATDLEEAKRALSEQRIIASMKPEAPIPAYNVPNPYCNNGCGCCGGMY